jgi:hypothetical protein
LAIGACSSGGGGGGGGGDGGSTSSGTTSSGSTGGPSGCKTYHACQLLTFNQVSAVVMTGGSDAGIESNVTVGPLEETLCAYTGPTTVGLDLTCGSPETPAQLIAQKMEAGATVTSIPNLGNQAVAVGDDAVVVWSGANNIISFQVTVLLPDGGSGAVNALSAAKTLAAEVLPEL